MSAAAISERALAFDCQGCRLLGVLAEPAEQAVDTAVLVIVGGPQVRAGSHRWFVEVARELAAAGVAVLRFDVRGMGDSEGEPQGFEQQRPDVAAALDALHAALPGLKRTLLWGLCDGASSALLYLHAQADPRIKGLVLLNPWVRSDQSLARTHVKHYYWQRLRQRSFWAKLLSGRVAASALSELLRNLRRAFGAETAPAAAGAAPTAPFQDRMALAARRFDGPLLLVLSGDDYTAREFDEHARGHPLWQAVLAQPRCTRLDLAGADHTLSQPEARAALRQATLAWLRGRPPPAA